MIAGYVLLSTRCMIQETKQTKCNIEPDIETNNAFE